MARPPARATSRALPVRTLLALLVLLAPLLALVPGSSASARGPMLHAPKVGSCHRYGLRAAGAPTDPRPAVRCSEPHTALTVAVLKVPSRIGFGNRQRLFRFFGPTCYRALYRKLGGTASQRAMSAYEFRWFIPTRAERRNGARWVRCDAVLAGRSSQPGLPRPLLPAEPLPDGVALCLYGRRLETTVCAHSHTYRAAATVRVRSRSYPGAARLTAIGRRICDRRITTVEYAWWTPSREKWQAGQRHIVCFARTSI